MAARRLSDDMEAHFSVRRSTLFRLGPLRRKQKMNRRDVEAAPADDQEHEWTNTHSFFAVMGGFAVRFAGGHVNFFPKLTHDAQPFTQLTLTPSGLLECEKLQKGFIPYLPRTLIQDKSNGNMLAKSLVCLQGELLSVQILP